MLDSFGVIQVSDWSDLTKDFISDRYLCPPNEDYKHKLTLSYWIQQMNAVRL